MLPFNHNAEHDTAGLRCRTIHTTCHIRAIRAIRGLPTDVHEGGSCCTDGALHPPAYHQRLPGHAADASVGTAGLVQPQLPMWAQQRAVINGVWAFVTVGPAVQPGGGNEAALVGWILAGQESKNVAHLLHHASSTMCPASHQGCISVASRHDPGQTA